VIDRPDVVAALAAAGLPVAVVNPRQAEAFPKVSSPTLPHPAARVQPSAGARWRVLPRRAREPAGGAEGFQGGLPRCRRKHAFEFPIRP